MNVVIIPRLDIGYFTLLERSLIAQGCSVKSTWKLPRRGAFFGRGVDVLHFHMLDAYFCTSGPYLSIFKFLYFSIIYRPVLKLRRIRLVWTCHETVPHQVSTLLRLQFRVWTEYFLRTADAVIVHSEAVLLSASLIHNRRVYKISHGDLTPIYSQVPESIPQELGGIRQSESIISCIGIIRRNKGIERIARAFLHAELDGTLLVIAGKPEDASLLAELKNLSQSNPQIILIARTLSDNEIVALHRRSLVVAFGFTSCYTSGSLITAMAHECCILAPRIGYAKEVLEGGGGELFEPTADPGEIGKQLRRLHGDQARICAFRLEAKRRITLQAWEPIAKITILTYRK